MSISNLLKSAAIISFGSILGYTSVKWLTPEPKNRSIASYPISKLGKVQNARNLFDVKLNTEGLAVTEDGTSTIKVSIEALKNFDSGLVYTWNLPQDIEVLEGPLTENLGAFSAGQSKEFTLKARRFSKQLKKFISFEIKGDYEQRPINREILISSRVEDSFEYVIQQNEKKHKGQVQKLGTVKSKNKFSPDRVIR